MNKTAKKLEIGNVELYDFGDIKLHAYQTNDPLADEVYIFEKYGHAAIVESPAFHTGVKELEWYINNLNLKIDGILLAYHMAAGGEFLKDARKYTTKNTEEYSLNGGGKALNDNFTNIFGENFDSTAHKATDYIGEGPITIAGIEFQISLTQDAFDIFVPEININYIHMLGHDCHSIIAGEKHADLIIEQLEGFIDNDSVLILNSHHTPENCDDAKMKINYINDIKATALSSKDADSFKQSIKQKYSNYTGENYLDMTTGFFFA